MANSEKKKILAVVTARGGSKGIPKKNIKLLGGVPLIAYSIAAAKKSGLITHAVVSTDSKEIADVARRYGGDVPFIRPKELAEDNSPHVPVLQHALKFMEEKEGIDFDYVVNFQPTSPFRTKEDIDETISLAIESDADSSVSLYEIPSGYHPVKIKKIEGNKVLPYSVVEEEGTRRQDLDKAYKRSSAVYVTKREVLMEGKLYGSSVVGHIVPIERSIDIDTPVDWERAEAKLKKLKQEGFDFI